MGAVVVVGSESSCSPNGYELSHRSDCVVIVVEMGGVVALVALSSLVDSGVGVVAPVVLSWLVGCDAVVLVGVALSWLADCGE